MSFRRSAHLKPTRAERRAKFEQLAKELGAWPTSMLAGNGAPPIRGPGGVSAVVCTDGKRRTVAKLIADGKRKFEEAKR